MLFRKRSKRSIPPPFRKTETDSGSRGALHAISFDMMLKGAITHRHGEPVRQIGVYVNGSIRLVTSGDHVDQETYDALVAEGVIAGPPNGSAAERSNAKKPRMIEDFGPHTEY